MRSDMIFLEACALCWPKFQSIIKDKGSIMNIWLTVQQDLINLIDEMEANGFVSTQFLIEKSKDIERGWIYFGFSFILNSIKMKPERKFIIIIFYFWNKNKSSTRNFDSFVNFQVETVFHEFGHALQHMLTKQDEGLVSGIRGIEWDAVELPSQFMENWCYHRYCTITNFPFISYFYILFPVISTICMHTVQNVT